MYRRRNRKVADLGFSSYQEYLASPLWGSIRQRVLQRDNGRCWGCGEKATQVHHGHYGFENLTGQDISDLWSLCGQCHEDCEFKGERKLAVNKTVKQLFRNAGLRGKISNVRRKRLAELRTIGNRVNTNAVSVLGDKANWPSAQRDKATENVPHRLTSGRR